MEQDIFIKRLIQLRMNKNVSAREMSLSIGQSPSYINNIECGKNLPSMTVFFYICDYLNITPKDFFDIDSTNPNKSQELANATKSLSNEKLDCLIALAKNMK